MLGLILEDSISKEILKKIKKLRLIFIMISTNIKFLKRKECKLCISWSIWKNKIIKSYKV